MRPRWRCARLRTQCCNSHPVRSATTASRRFRQPREANRVCQRAGQRMSTGEYSGFGDRSGIGHRLGRRPPVVTLFCNPAATSRTNLVLLSPRPEGTKPPGNQCVVLCGPDGGKWWSKREMNPETVAPRARSPGQTQGSKNDLRVMPARVHLRRRCQWCL